MTEGPNVPTYKRNQTIQAEVEVVLPPDMVRVVAFFKHATDIYANSALVGRVEAGSSGRTSVLLKGMAMMPRDAYGEYLCVSFHAEDANGQSVAFLSVPEVRFRIIRDDVVADEAAYKDQPALLKWTWKR